MKTKNADPQPKSNKTIAVPVGEIPIGTILPYYGNLNQLPDGYLWCDGTAVPKTIYPLLWAHLYQANGGSSDPSDPEKVLTPNLKDEFIRGWGYDEKVRRLGSKQEEDIKEHTHTLVGKWQKFVNGSGYFQSVEGNADTNITDPTTNGGNWGSKKGKETRPRNIALSFIIKAKYA